MVLTGDTPMAFLLPVDKTIRLTQFTNSSPLRGTIDEISLETADGDFAGHGLGPVEKIILLI